MLINRQIDVIKGLGTCNLASKWLSLLDTLADRVQSDSFKVLVLGQFNRGKSTFINALLAEKVLPTYATPTTAVINEVKYDEQKYAVLYPRQAHGQGPAQPRRIPLSQLEDYVVVDLEYENKPNPFERAEVFWPLDLCRSGVEMGVARVVLPRAGVIAISGLMIGLAPPFLIPIAASVFAGWTAKSIGDQGEKMGAVFQRNVGNQAAAKLRETSVEYVKLVGDSAQQQLGRVKEILIGNLQGKVTGLREQMEAALEQKQTGEEEVEATRARFTGLESKMAGIDAALDRLIDEILVSTRAGAFTRPAAGDEAD